MDIIAELTSVVGTDAVLNAADDMAPFLLDWHSRFTGQAHAVVFPKTTAQVAKIMEFASKQGIVVVPQGGNTGFVGGATPDSQGNTILLSLRRMHPTDTARGKRGPEPLLPTQSGR